LGYVKSVETLVPATPLPSMADSPDALPNMLATAMPVLDEQWSTLIGRFASRTASDETRQQVAAMLHDPRIAGTPAASFLAAYLGDETRSTQGRTPPPFS
jgi:hypothetical protein